MNLPVNSIINGDALEVLRTLPDCCFDSCVTDPPYGLSFMGKKWDYDVPSVEVWREVYRVLKPGAHLLSFGGTRTYHRMVVNIEDAGFEIRDQLQWIYGSGFPKSLDVSKAIDKAAGAERLDAIRGGHMGIATSAGDPRNDRELGNIVYHGVNKGLASRGTPVLAEAAQWSGWGTALKPANEPICLARKPIEGNVADNILKWGTGAINIDGCRIETDNELRAGSGGLLSHVRDGKAYPNSSRRGEQSEGRTYENRGGTNFKMKPGERKSISGRWPSNVILDEEAAAMLDKQSGTRKAGATVTGNEPSVPAKNVYGKYGRHTFESHGDIGGASRFFYCAKASRSERNQGLDGEAEKPLLWSKGSQNPGSFQATGTNRAAQNNHPTVKPVDLMKYLCKLITPQKGIILDPFCGSGTTGIAARDLGFKFVLIDRVSDYCDISQRRVTDMFCQPEIINQKKEVG